MLNYAGNAGDTGDLLIGRGGNGHWHWSVVPTAGERRVIKAPLR